MKPSPMMWTAFFSLQIGGNHEAMENRRYRVVGFLCGGGVALAAEESSCGKRMPVTTVYEVTLEEGATAEMVQSVKASVEKRDAFAASNCEEKVLDRGAAANLAYSCAKSDVKTDEIFRNVVSQYGAKLTTGAAISLTCPTGCKTSANCTGGVYYTCCKSPGTGQYCPGYAP